MLSSHEETQLKWTNNAEEKQVWDLYCLSKTSLPEQQKEQYTRQLNMLKTYHEELKQTEGLDNIEAQRKKTLYASLTLYIRDIEEKMSNTYFFGFIDSYSRHDLAYSLYCCNKMLEDPCEQNVDEFLAATPKTGNWEYAYHVAKAVLGLALVSAGCYILFKAIALGWFVTSTVDSSSSYYSNVPVLDAANDTISALQPICAAIFNSALLTGIIAPFAAGGTLLANSCSFFFPTYKQAQKKALTDVVSAMKKPPVDDAPPPYVAPPSAPLMINT